MKKITLILFFFIFIFTGCQRTEVVNVHGISYLKAREKLIFINKSNKNDIINILGQPSTKGMIDNNTWIYIERTKTRGKMFKLGRNYLKKNNVLILEFNKFGVLNKKEFLDKNDMNKINFAKATTENEVRRENFYI